MSRPCVRLCPPWASHGGLPLPLVDYTWHACLFSRPVFSGLLFFDFPPPPPFWGLYLDFSINYLGEVFTVA